MLTGIGTVLRDAPELTARQVPCARQPRRVVIDSRLEMPLDARILKGEPPVIFAAVADPGRQARLESLGARVVMAPGPGRKTDLAAVVAHLGALGFNEVTVESGARLNGSLLRAGLVDELVLYLAPALLGDRAQGLFALPEFTHLGEALRPRIVDVRAVGGDLRITARLEA